MKIDPAARPFVAVTAAPTLAAALSRRPRAAAALGLLTAGVTLFFRDPDRAPDLAPVEDPDVVLAPADGVIVHAGPAQPDVSPPGEWQQVSIFLSLLDVHINRAPYGGRVVSVTHQPGRFLAAYRAASGMKNERTEIVVERSTPSGPRRVIYRQIVGQLARRIVTRIAPGDEVPTGARIGLMKFGSRMDVFLPMDVVLEVAPRTRAVAGVTVLGRFTPGAAPSPAGEQVSAGQSSEGNS